MNFLNKILCFAVLSLVSEVSSSFIQGCYFTNSTTNSQQQLFQDFKLETYPPGLCSHLFFSYTNIKDDLMIDMLNPGILKWGVENKFFNSITELKFQQPDLKTVLSLGGTCDFKDIVADDVKRQKFVKAAADFVNQFNFDGVDIDITQPINDKQGLTNLINELKEVFPEKLVSISVSTLLKRFDSLFDVPAIAETVDFVNILTVQNSFISGTNSNTFDSMFNWVSNGMPKNKLIVGLNIHGSNSTTDKIDSNELSDNSINVKNKWMKENGFGGAFVRLIDDTIVDDEFSAFDKNSIDGEQSNILADCCVYPDTDIVMNNLSAHAGQPSDCCDLCADLGFGCKAYVWNDYAGGTCWFKTATGPPAVQFGYIAGTVGSCDNLNKKEKQKSKTEL